MGPHELAFTAQTFNAPCLLGRLLINPEDSSLTMRARLQWSFYAIFVVGFAIVGFPWPVFLFMGLMFVVNYVWEVRTFQRLFRVVGDEIERSSGRRAP